MFRLEDGKWARVGVVFNENERTISDLRVDGVVVERSVINTKKASSTLYVDGADVEKIVNEYLDSLWIRPGKDGCMVALRVSEEEMRALREKEEE